MTDNKNRCDFNSIKVLIDNKHKNGSILSISSIRILSIRIK